MNGSLYAGEHLRVEISRGRGRGRGGGPPRSSYRGGGRGRGGGDRYERRSPPHYSRDILVLQNLI